MPQWDGGLDRSGRKLTAVWPKIVRLVLARGRGHRRVRGGPVRRGRDPPRPNQLLSAAAVARYEAAVGDGGRRAALLLKIRTISSSWRRRGTRRCTAGARPTRPGPRSGTRRCRSRRYIGIASRSGRMKIEIAAEFFDRAVEQYLSGSCGYRTGWAEMLPPVFDP